MDKRDFLRTVGGAAAGAVFADLGTAGQRGTAPATGDFWQQLRARYRLPADRIDLEHGFYSRAAEEVLAAAWFAEVWLSATATTTTTSTARRATLAGTYRFRRALTCRAPRRSRAVTGRRCASKCWCPATGTKCTCRRPTVGSAKPAVTRPGRSSIRVVAAALGCPLAGRPARAANG